MYSSSHTRHQIPTVQLKIKRNLDLGPTSGPLEARRATTRCIAVRPQRERRQAATLAIVRANENLASEKKGERQDQKTNELASRKRQNELAAKQEAKLQVSSDGLVVLEV